MELTKPLVLTDQQRAQLEMHSFLNVFNVLIGELEILNLDLPDPGALAETTRMAHAILAQVKEGRLDYQAAQMAAALPAVFEREIEALFQAWPSCRDGAECAQSVGNLRSILQVLGARLREFLERAQGGIRWLPHDIRQLDDNFRNFFAAVEKNSKGRYHIIYNIAAQETNDYLVQLKIESVSGEIILMPPVLQDVLRDLLANARKYTPPGGEITAGVMQDQEQLRLVVEDTGCGIPAEEIEKVVEFGCRGSNVQNKQTRGAGFGLTKACYVTQSLGGRMWIESTLGQGTRIALHLPLPATRG